MYKLMSAVALVLVTSAGTFASIGAAAAAPKIIIQIPQKAGASGPVSSPGEPFQPFQQTPGARSVPTSNSLAEACDGLGGRLLQVQDGARVDWVCVR